MRTITFHKTAFLSKVVIISRSLPPLHVTVIIYHINEHIQAIIFHQKTRIMASGPITSWQTDGETVETVADFIFWAPKSLQMVTAAMKLKDVYPWKESYDQSTQHIKK